MTSLIIEDEPQAALHLERLLMKVEPSLRILSKIDSVTKAVEWLSSNNAPDLIFMDIELADGTSFSIFDRVNVSAPVIFTTAYDEYALKAFKVNSVDYILKPIDEGELSTAISKFKETKTSSTEIRLAHIDEAIRQLTKRFKTRFVIKVGEHLRTIETSAITYFYSQDKTTFCVTVDKRHHILDLTLEQLEDCLDPKAFYRVNRKHVISAVAIQDIISYTNSRLKIILKEGSGDDVIVARERVQDFKRWLDA